jgi:hypothetical protein
VGGGEGQKKQWHLAGCPAAVD